MRARSAGTDTGGEVTLTLEVNGVARNFAIEDDDPAAESTVPVNKNKTVKYTIAKWGTAPTGAEVVVTATGTSSNGGAVGTS